MANLGDRTRKQQVQKYLIDHAGEWVDGPDLSNEAVGGSEGLRRLRELVDEGHPIEARRHPDAYRDIWQYRWVVKVKTTPMRGTLQPNAPSDVPGVDSHLQRFDSPPSKLDFGAIAVCPRCKGRTKLYVPKGDTRRRHKDPTKAATPCIQCNGWGIIPNKGPIAITIPEGLG